MANQDDKLSQLRRRDFLRLLSGGALTLASGGLLTGCGGGGGGSSSSDGGSTPPVSLSPGQILNSGSLALPPGSSLNPGQLVVQTTLDAGQPISTGGGSSSGKYQVIASSQNNHLMMAVKNEADGSQTPYLLAISTGSAGTSPTIDENSTATALVFLNPFVGVSDPTAAQALLAQIATLSETAILAGTIKNALTAGHSPLDGTDPTINTALAAAIKAELHALTPQITIQARPTKHDTTTASPNQEQSGITVSVTAKFTADATGMNIPVTVKNKKFRYLDAYFRPVADAEGNPVSARQNDKRLDYFIWDSTATGLSETISAAIGMFSSDHNLASSQDVSLSGSNANRYILSLYGPGSLTDQAYVEGNRALLFTTIFDTLGSLVTAITGLAGAELDLRKVVKQYIDGVSTTDDLIQKAVSIYNEIKQGNDLAAAKDIAELTLPIIGSNSFRDAVVGAASIGGEHYDVKQLLNFSANTKKLLGRLDFFLGAADILRSFFDQTFTDTQVNFLLQLSGTGTGAVQITRLMPEQGQQLLCAADARGVGSHSWEPDALKSVS